MQNDPSRLGALCRALHEYVKRCEEGSGKKPTDDEASKYLKLIAIAANVLGAHLHQASLDAEEAKKLGDPRHRDPMAWMIASGEAASRDEPSALDTRKMRAVLDETWRLWPSWLPPKATNGPSRSEFLASAYDALSVACVACSDVDRLQARLRTTEEALVAEQSRRANVEARAEVFERKLGDALDEVNRKMRALSEARQLAAERLTDVEKARKQERRASTRRLAGEVAERKGTIVLEQVLERFIPAPSLSMGLAAVPSEDLGALDGALVDALGDQRELVHRLRQTLQSASDAADQWRRRFADATKFGNPEFVPLEDHESMLREAHQRGLDSGRREVLDDLTGGAASRIESILKQGVVVERVDGDPTMLNVTVDPDALARVERIREEIAERIANFEPEEDDDRPSVARLAELPFVTTAETRLFDPCGGRRGSFHVSGNVLEGIDDEDAEAAGRAFADLVRGL